MRLFKCPSCDQVLYFENTRCERCQHLLGYDPASFTLRALVPEAGDAWRDTSSERRWRFCANAAQHACNWLVPDDEAGALCAACRHNRTIPDLSDPGQAARWRSLEAAKHRLFYALMRLDLPLPTRQEDPAHGLAFDVLAETPAQPLVLTGHEDGIITIALKEGDDAERARMRQEMGELYRTPLGHFRHEIGHYYWDRLVGPTASLPTSALDECRALFGDERADYAAALRAHYARPSPTGWRENHVSAYATSHPWEDFAESWAHYLHIIDTLEMAACFGISIHPQVARGAGLQADIDFDPYRTADFDLIMQAWLPLTFAMNSLNRAMGQPDLYPFVLAPGVVEKLGFVHRLIARK